MMKKVSALSSLGTPLFMKMSKNKDARRTMLAIVTVIALGVLAIMVVVIPNRLGTQPGVGADGYSVFLVNTDLGVDKVVSKQATQAALGDVAKDVADVDKSGVISLGGNQGQTATFGFTTQAGTRSTVYVDVLAYKSQDAYNQAKVFAGTGKAGTINGLEVRYLPAINLGPDHEYALLVSKGTKSYKFAMTQPNDRVEIREVTAQDILKRMISAAQL